MILTIEIAERLNPAFLVLPKELLCSLSKFASILTKIVINLQLRIFFFLECVSH